MPPCARESEVHRPTRCLALRDNGTVPCADAVLDVMHPSRAPQSRWATIGFTLKSFGELVLLEVYASPSLLLCDLQQTLMLSLCYPPPYCCCCPHLLLSGRNSLQPLPPPVTPHLLLCTFCCCTSRCFCCCCLTSNGRRVPGVSKSCAIG